MRNGVILTVIVLVALVGIYFYIEYRHDKANQIINVKIDSLTRSKNDLMLMDSIRVSIEKKIVDSMQADLKIRDYKIKNIEREIAKNRKANEDLRRLFNSISVDMPNY